MTTQRGSLEAAHDNQKKHNVDIKRSWRRQNKFTTAIRHTTRTEEAHVTSRRSKAHAQNKLRTARTSTT